MNHVMKWTLVSLMLVVSSSVFAQGSACRERDYWIEGLEEKYGEVVKHMGITGRGALVEFTVAPDGSWSMLVTLPGPNGLTCMTAEGTDWQDVPDVPIVKGTSA